MIEDWKTEIAKTWLLKQAMMEADTKKIWTYHLPEVAAADLEIRDAEQCLGHSLDSRYKDFLKHANGWKGFVQTIDLFGTTGLINGPQKENGEFILSNIDDDVLNGCGVARNEIFPIAATMRHRDLFVITRPFSKLPGLVLWLAGEEIERYESFDDFFIAMQQYNRHDLAALRKGT